jgi:hypothetical protein
MVRDTSMFAKGVVRNVSVSNNRQRARMPSPERRDRKLKLVDMQNIERLAFA